MGRFASNKGGSEFAQAPIGTHVARCFRLIDLGTQRDEFQGKVNIRNQVMISWELPDELMPDGEHEGKPFVVSKFYTNSLHEKATLRHHLEAWRGKEFTPAEESQFDLQNILGAPCMLSVVHSETGKAKVGAVMAMPKGQKCPPAINPTSAFWLDEFDAEAFEKLSDGLKEIIKKSPEYQAAVSPRKLGNGAAPADDLDDSIPF